MTLESAGFVCWGRQALQIIGTVLPEGHVGAPESAVTTVTAQQWKTAIVCPHLCALTALEQVALINVDYVCDVRWLIIFTIFYVLASCVKVLVVWFVWYPTHRFCRHHSTEKTYHAMINTLN